MLSKTRFSSPALVLAALFIVTGFAAPATLFAQGVTAERALLNRGAEVLVSAISDGPAVTPAQALLGRSSDGREASYSAPSVAATSATMACPLDGPRALLGRCAAYTVNSRGERSSGAVNP